MNSGVGSFVVEREVLLLIGMEGHTYEEVSEMTDLPVGTVKSRLSRARSRLRKVMTEPAPAMQKNRCRSQQTRANTFANAAAYA
jgi:hypothetical protein